MCKVLSKSVFEKLIISGCPKTACCCRRVQNLLFLQTTYFKFFLTTSPHNHFYLARAAILFSLWSFPMFSLGKRHTFHLPLSVIFFCSLYCMFENCYKYVLFKSHLICTGTAEDPLKPACEKGCNHEYEYAAAVIVAHPAGNQSQSSILLSYPKENNGNNKTHLYSVLWTNHRAALKMTPSCNSQQKNVL